MSRATEAYARFSMAMQTTEPDCQGDDRFTEDSISTEMKLRLAETCAVCPLFDLCEEYAQLERPKAGLWAGRTYRTNQTKENN